MKITLTILALIFSIHAVAHNKVAVIPLIENAPPSNTVYVKSNGVNIGVLIDLPDYRVISMKGYVFKVDLFTGKLKTSHLYFISNDCTGQAYLWWGSPDRTLISQPYIFVISAPPNYSVPTVTFNPNATPVMITPGSVWSRVSDPDTGESEYTCNSFYYDPKYEATYIPTIPNNPAVTGVQHSYALPITIGF